MPGEEKIDPVEEKRECGGRKEEEKVVEEGTGGDGGAGAAEVVLGLGEAKEPVECGEEKIDPIEETIELDEGKEEEEVVEEVIGGGGNAGAAKPTIGLGDAEEHVERDERGEEMSNLAEASRGQSLGTIGEYAPCIGMWPVPGGRKIVTNSPPSILAGPTRSSARLNSARKISALERAKLRKVALLEGETSGATSLPRHWNINKVMKKSALCGVRLSGVEAQELQKFLLRG